MPKNSKDMKTMQCAATRNNLPGFWEKRDEKSMLTLVELISDDNFRPKKGIFINRTKNIDKKYHVIFVPKTGDIIAQVVRSNSTNTTRFYLFTVIQTFQDVGQKFFLQAEELGEFRSVNEAVEKFGEDCREFLVAAEAKLDSDTVNSFFTQPMSISPEYLNA